MHCDAARLVSDLKAFGIEPGMRLVVHSSLRSFGYVDGGAETVIDALLGAVGPEGTVFMPVMTFGEPFDSEMSPSRCGAITEAFRLRPDAIRSQSPTHSIAGIGPDAEYILAGHDGDFPLGPNGPGTPLDRLVYDGGHILLLGVTHTRNTIAHLVWYRAGIPLYEQWRDVEVTDREGSTSIVHVRHPGCSGGFHKLDEVFNSRGIQRIGTIGSSEARLIKALDCVDAGMEAVRENSSLLFCDDPACFFCRYAEKIRG